MALNKNVAKGIKTRQENELLENNKLIAEFMGMDSFKDSLASLHQGKINVDVDVYEQAQYHTSWDWLMPVVEKIENLDRLAGIVTINQNCCTIKSNMLGDNTIMSKQAGSNYQEANTKLSNTYKAVVEFIKWYSEKED
tara:strand:+ start:3294 stop:3707 length:414 start_codon:yes stop_codon:yes gene_type:complete